MNNQNQFKQTLAGMAEIYGREVSATMAKIYWDSLTEFTDEQVDAAFTQAINTIKFFPKPAELRELIVGKSGERALEAWGTVLLDVRNGAGRRPLSRMDEGELVEYSNKPRSEDDVIGIVASLGGWSRLGQMTTRDLDFLKKDFIQMYQSKSDRGEIKALPPAETKLRITNE